MKKTFLFTTTVTIDDTKYWLDSSIIRNYYIKADGVELALIKYAELVEDSAYIFISNNAMKNKSEQFIDLPNGDCIQTGYVIKGKTDIDGKQKYVDLWVTIEQITNLFA